MLWRVTAAGSRNFVRNAWLSVAATAVMVVTLTIMLAAVVFNMALGSTLDQVTQKIDIAVYFQNSASREDISRFEDALNRSDNVTSTYFVSKTEALERYRDTRANSQDELGAVSEGNNPLPRSVEVQVDDLQRIGEVATLAQSERYAPLVEDTSLDEDKRRTIQRIAETREFLITFGIVATLVFAGISMLIIFNTIRMAIFARGEEIGIMRLIGATNAFIRGPFLFEAMLDGIIAALISTGLVYAAMFRGGSALFEFVNFESTLSFFAESWPVVLLATLAAGVAIGMLSSLLAMVRYLRL